MNQNAAEAGKGKNNAGGGASTGTGITPIRSTDYAEWYQQVIKAAELAENSVVRGCMVIRPWGYGIWERMQRELDDRIKATGHENAYFPLFIPLSFLQKEAEHVTGFAKECAVVTHHRLELKDGKLVPAGELEEPVIVRPTSETIIGESFSRWIKSYRDLPMLINQWANVVRWEMRTRLFLRTSEFLWQEGHTAHASEKEAMEETYKMLEVYREFMETVLAMPIFVGEKPAHERFPGAVRTFCCEAMMQDRKALQAGTSHYLGTNFAKASGIEFVAEDSSIQTAFTTSWGVSTRLVGGVIMTHGDDDGLRLPPSLAPKQVVILPVIPNSDAEESVLRACEQLAQQIRKAKFGELGIQVHIDKRDKRGGEKNWEWIKRGVPIRIEIGPRDIEKQQVCLSRRDKAHKEKLFIANGELPAKVAEILVEIQHNLFAQAKAHSQQHVVDSISNYDELKTFFTPKNTEKPEIHGGFVKAKWCGDPKSLPLLEELKLSIRCIPFEQSGSSGKCVLTGKDATQEVLIAKSY